ncbi:MAG TPA: DUF4097 family beta strand repeat-containing protein [Candidatus Acidoferrum sp.]|nr:DUF4097 family beta strand repeat-containing protein [Candidatus Acidoferrum sp.]
MARTQTRSSGLFSGLVLISVGVILLLHNYGHLDLGHFFGHWWPLIIIFWGAVKLYERTAGARTGGATGGGITGGEVALVVGMLALLGIVVGAEYGKQKIGEGIVGGDDFNFDLLDVPPKTIPANARVFVHNSHGDISVRSSDDAQIRVSGKKGVKTWSEEEAGRITKPVAVEIAKNGDSYEVRPSGYDLSDARIRVDMEVSVPKKSPLTVKTEKGDVTVSDMTADIGVTDQNGDVEIRNIAGDVLIEMRKGDVKVNDTKGDVKVSGKGGEIDVTNAAGSLTVDGDFYGPVRADKVAKGVRMISAKTDLTLSALAGHLEAGSGNLDVVDAPGNLILRTRDNEISVENPGGKVNIENRNAAISVRFTSAPKDDVNITNSSGEISLSLPGSSSFEVQAECRNCDISSEFPGLSVSKSPAGDASLAATYGSGRRPKIMLKTSYGNISLRRTAMAISPPKRSAVPAPPAAPIPPETEQ